MSERYPKEVEASTHYELGILALRWAKKAEAGRTKAEHLRTVWCNFCHDLPAVGIYSLSDLCWYDSHGRLR